MADEQTLNHIMNEYEELRISAANERKKRIEEVNKKIPRVAEIDREIFQCEMCIRDRRSLAYRFPPHAKVPL